MIVSYQIIHKPIQNSIQNPIIQFQTFLEINKLEFKQYKIYSGGELGRRRNGSEAIWVGGDLGRRRNGGGEMGGGEMAEAKWGAPKKPSIITAQLKAHI